MSQWGWEKNEWDKMSIKHGMSRCSTLCDGTYLGGQGFLQISRRRNIENIDSMIKIEGMVEKKRGLTIEITREEE